MSIEMIKSSEVYKQVIKDSCGGLMYNAAKRGTYQADEILAQWDALEPHERETCGGIMKGAMAFLKGE